MTTALAPAAATPAAIPKASFDWKPVALLVGLMALAFPAIGSPSSWLTLTVAGLAMGMIVFIIASGLTLVFGLMDVLNFGHGVFIALGAFMATSVMGYAAGAGWNGFVAIFASMLVAMAELSADESLQQRLLGLSLGAHQ